jgi:hypothetical protein
MAESKVGNDLALRVAKRMRMKCDLMHSHRDYCGTGLSWIDGSYIYGHVYDGYMGQAIESFEREHEFVTWLAEQSDLTLSGMDETDASLRGNQRLTVARMFEFVSGRPTVRFEG